jgi:hypothetical protein
MEQVAENTSLFRCNIWYNRSISARTLAVLADIFHSYPFHFISFHFIFIHPIDQYIDIGYVKSQKQSI